MYNLGGGPHSEIQFLSGNALQTHSTLCKSLQGQVKRWLQQSMRRETQDYLAKGTEASGLTHAYLGERFVKPSE